ncbi:MAG: hypothetical protein SF339_23215 [Blastocatellia bacterium]|nr:hypothetical protein [Blastocatellia bacterium]
MLRIEEEKTEAARTLRLDGRLVREWVEVLREHVEGAVELDLAGVTFADAAGVELLRRLEARGVPLRGCSPFLREQIGLRAD